jgi:hypothetical protein
VVSFAKIPLVVRCPRGALKNKLYQDLEGILPYDHHRVSEVLMPSDEEVTTRAGS